MTNQDSGRGARRRAQEQNDFSETAHEASSAASSKASSLAQQAAGKAREAASDTASTLSLQLKELLDSQISSSADMAGQFAVSAKRAAADLEQDAPQLAGFVRIVADQVERYAGDLKDQSVDQLVRAASDFTRRQPALVFGLAAMVGFLAYRTLKSTSVAAPPIQPMHEDAHSIGSEAYGA